MCSVLIIKRVKLRVELSDGMNFNYDRECQNDFDKF